jgi:hypothetical protein
MNELKYFYLLVSKDQCLWTFDVENNCGDIEFSNDGLSAKKKGAANPSTLLGSRFFDESEDEIKWSIKIEEHVGSYICIGVISNQFIPNFRIDNYNNAHCVCSDNTTYNINHISGQLVMQVGQTIYFTYSRARNEFIAEGENNAFKFSSALNPAYSYRPFFGFAAAARIKISIVHGL